MLPSTNSASGIWNEQAARARRPSAASEVCRRMPSRIRRAIFRITGESSTTRTCFILASWLESASELGGVGAAMNIENAERIDDRDERGFKAQYAGHQGR